MKKILFVFPAVLTMYLSSCKRGDVLPKSITHSQTTSNRLNKTAQEYEALYDQIIETVAYGILDLSQSPEFRTVVSNEVEIKFDGDDNVLLRTLDSALSASGINLRESMRQSLINHGKANDTSFIEYAINGLPYFDGVIFSQIYVPFYEGKNIISSSPTICLNYEDEPVLQGLNINQGTVSDVLINEEDAKVSNVFVVSFNETVGNDGRVLSNPEPGIPPTDPSELSELAGAKGLMIDAINVIDKKEGWGNGRADISFIAITTRAGCNRQPDAVGWPFCKLANKDLGKWFYPSYGNKSIADGFSTFWEQLHPEEISIVFFEADRRMKFTRSFSPSYCSYTLAYYQSKETPYGVVNPYIGNYNSKNYTTHPLSGGQFKLVGWPVF